MLLTADYNFQNVVGNILFKDLTSLQGYILWPAIYYQNKEINTISQVCVQDQLAGWKACFSRNFCLLCVMPKVLFYAKERPGIDKVDFVLFIMSVFYKLNNN